ncbi:MAG TPA: MerR family transcriptional regulator [Clostridiales bacterium]|nr:MerR family transcriptional regulator [Clostridiales bacterium]HPV01996.1 MerR family transcriptional regulator [Clostridiales bacterium]
MEVLKERYSITELSEMLQLSDHTLRFYEKECELEVPKDERGRRYYTPELANMMYKIKLMRSEGLELKAIKRILQQDRMFFPAPVPDDSTTSLAPPAGREIESVQALLNEIGRQLAKEISYELDSTREHLSREIAKSKLELGACVENSIRRLESRMEKHYEEVDRAISNWRKRNSGNIFRRIFYRVFGAK